MSRLTIPKIPLKSLIMIIRDYLSLPRLISKGTLPKNEIFHRPKTIQSDSYPFLWSRQHEPFWAKKTKIVQTWLKPCPLIGTTWTTFDPKEPCQDSSHCRDTPSQHPPTIKAPNLNKEKEMKKRNYDIFIMHSRYLNKSQQEKSSSKKRETWSSRERKIWSD